jgi:sugar transferase (PEP-CTERM/EpsH1 system associated)
VNILYLCHRIPYPPDKGDKIRSFHQIEYLARRHRLHVACFVDAEEDRAHVATLRPYCASLDAVWRGSKGATLRAGLALLGPESLSVAAFHSADLARRIDARVREGGLDAAIVFCSAMAQYLPDGTDLPTIVDYVDVDSEKWRVYAERKPWPLSWVYRTEADRLRRYERKLSRRYDESVFVAEKEADVFRKSAGGAHARVIPNGVDLEYFTRGPDGAPAERPSLVFVGMMDYFPNEDAVDWFAEEIFPRIRVETPGVTFRIVGRNPAKRVRDLARLPSVEVVGGVADVRPYVREAAVSVAPFRIARGLQNKVLEAMAMEVPVVGTSMAFQGIAAGAEDGIRVAEDPAAFARAVTDLLRDPATARDLGRRGRRFVEQNHRWQDHGEALEALLSEVVERRARPLPSAGGRR